MIKFSDFLHPKNFLVSSNLERYIKIGIFPVKTSSFWYPTKKHIIHPKPCPIVTSCAFVEETLGRHLVELLKASAEASMVPGCPQALAVPMPIHLKLQEISSFLFFFLGALTKKNVGTERVGSNMLGTF